MLNQLGLPQPDASPANANVPAEIKPSAFSGNQANNSQDPFAAPFKSAGQELKNSAKAYGAYQPIVNPPGVPPTLPGPAPSFQPSPVSNLSPAGYGPYQGSSPPPAAQAPPILPGNGYGAYQAAVLPPFPQAPPYNSPPPGYGAYQAAATSPTMQARRRPRLRQAEWVSPYRSAVQRLLRCWGRRPTGPRICKLLARFSRRRAPTTPQPTGKRPTPHPRRNHRDPRVAPVIRMVSSVP